MGWFEKLKEFVNIDFKIDSLIKIVFIKNSKINSDNTSIEDSKVSSVNPLTEEPKEYIYNEEENTLVFNGENISDERKEKLKPIIKDYIQEENMLLKTNTSEKLKKVELYNKKDNKDDKRILEFFRDIIPSKDLEALEISLFLRDGFRNGYDIKEMKRDIRKKFGDRGNNISNLCTAGYFETFIQKLRNETSKEEFSELYEQIVSNYILAVFVNEQMSVFQITEEIKKKINASMRYGFKFVDVHGIGTQNINKIMSCIENNRDFFDFYEKVVFQRGNIVIVKLLIK